MSQAVRDMFAGIARRYDLANRLLSGGRDVAWRRRSLRAMRHAPHRVLDLACGTGDLGRDARRLLAAELVVGADFCLPMIQAGAEKFACAGIRPATADALRLPFADGAFDAAMIAYGWRNVDDPQQALRELYRVLRPGGQLLIIEFFKPTTAWPKLFHATFSRHLIPLLGGVITQERAAYTYLHHSIAGFLSTREAERLIQAAGFRDQRWQRHCGGVSHAVIAQRT